MELSKSVRPSASASTKPSRHISEYTVWYVWTARITSLAERDGQMESAALRLSACHCITFAQ